MTTAEPPLKHVDLFAGCGGLALGCEEAGFEPYLYVDNDQRCIETLQMNRYKHPSVQIAKANVASLSYGSMQRDITLLSGGVPCQPWSAGGMGKGWEDDRNMWPEFFRAQRALLPKVVLAENVSGILQNRFAPYFRYIVNQMKKPTVARWHDQPWEDHASQLVHSRGGGSKRDVSYDVHLLQLNAKDYGVPQDRERVFLVGFRRDIEVTFDFERCVLCDPITLGEAIADLGKPGPPMTHHDHIYIPGARIYRGHTPNELDKPAKTVKAGVHGMPGGEGVVRLPDGTIRYLTVRELARIQTFPDWYRFAGPRSAQIHQIGNAVPVNLALHVAREIHDALYREQR
jgi:DNA (cytosine-5)-methyltransferase 1